MKGRFIVLAIASLLPFLGCSREEPVRGEDGYVRRVDAISVFDLRVGDCAIPPEKVTKDFQGNLPTITVMPCQAEHTLEYYDKVPYSLAPDRPGTSGTTVPANIDTYPGEAALKLFADSRCANRFEAYVSTAYTDSKLFLTYLTPSVRSWNDPDQRDRDVLCFVTTAGEKLTSSVKGSGK